MRESLLIIGASDPGIANRDAAVLTNRAAAYPRSRPRAGTGSPVSPVPGPCRRRSQPRTDPELITAPT